MEKHDTTTNKIIKNIKKNFKSLKNNSKLPHYKIVSLLEQKKSIQLIISQILSKIEMLEDSKLQNLNTSAIITINDKIIHYTDLLLFYKNKLKNICNLLKEKCNHVIIHDCIDISSDKSQSITYCENCETTF